jgi:hypothetical protein
MAAARIGDSAGVSPAASLTNEETLRYSRHVRQAGFRKIYNLHGGILSREVDPTAPR